MQSKKINELGTNLSPSVNDLTVVGDASTGQLKKITLSQIAALFGSSGSVSSIATTAPLTGGTITTSGTLGITQATTSANGYLSSSDWNLFNGKQAALSGTGFIKISGTTVSYDNSSYYLASNPSSFITLSSLSGNSGVSYNNTTGVISSTITQYTDALARASLSFTAGNASYNNTTGVITIPTNNTQLTNGSNYIVLSSLSAGTGISYNNTTGVITSTISQYTDALARAAFSESVTGLDYNSTTGVLSTATGYSIPSTASQTNWTAAYDDTITSAAVTGTTTKTLTLTQRDSGTITASWTDINTDAVSSVFGRTGAVVATSGDYTTTQVTEGTNLYYTQARFDTAFGLKSTTNLTEGTNLYFTNTRSRSSISLTTTGTSGAATYDNATGVLNIPSYIGGVTSVNTLTGAVTLTTSNIAEGTNLYYTDTRARLALSFVAGSGAYNSTTGVITIPTNNTQITNGSNYITLGSLSGSTGISYNSTTGAISSTITQYTDALARTSLSFVAGSGAYNGTTGIITIPTNNNQITNGAGYITSSALSSYVPYTGATGTVNLGSNTLVAGLVGIGISPSSKLHLYDGTNPLSLKIQRTSVPVYLSDVQPASTTAASSWSHNVENTSNGSETWGSFANTGYAGSAIMLNADTSNSYITFLTASAVNTVPTSKMRLDNDGQLNLAPYHTQAKFCPGADVNQYLRYNTSVDGMELSGYSGVMFSTVGGTERMRITSGGNILIGTTTDNGYKLQVNGDIYASGNLVVSGAKILNFGGASLGLFIETAVGWTYGSGYGINIASSGANTLIITAVNNSGVSRGGRFDFSSIASSNHRLYTLPDADGTLALTSNLSSYLPLSGGTLTGALTANGVSIGASDVRSSSNVLTLGGTSEVMRIVGSTGNVGIGTSTPSQILSVVSADNTQNAISSFAANNLTQQVEIWYGGIKMGGTAAAADLNFANKGAANMLFSTNSSERMRITSTGIINTTSRLNVNGAIDNSLFSLSTNGTLYTVGFSPNMTYFSSTTLTMTTGYTTYIYNGSGTATWTLPTPTGTNQMFWIKNLGTGTITLNSYSGTNIINNSGTSVTSITISIGATVLIQQDGYAKSIQLQ